MEKVIYCIEGRTSSYYFQGYEVDHYFPCEYGSVPQEQKIELEKREQATLRPLIDEWYSGGTQIRFWKDEAGLVYFRREFGDRRIIWSLRFPVKKTFGRIVVLDVNQVEMMREYFDKDAKRWAVRAEWGPLTEEYSLGFVARA